MRRPTNPVVVIGIVVGLLQRGKAADLKKETAATEEQIQQYRTLAAQAKATPPIRVAELFRLTKAMPDEVDMAGVLLELSRVARETGIEFESITPQGPAVQTGYTSVPITLEFDGNYYELSDFLFRLRSLVRVQSGRLEAQGRLFVVESISFNESPKTFPRIKASLTVRAFVYGDATTTATAPPAAGPAATTPTDPAAPPSPDVPPEGASAAPGTVTP